MKQFKKSTIFVFTILLSTFYSNSQNLINEDFESWIDNSAFIDPEGWITLNDLSPEYGIPFTVLQSSDANEGKFAAQMQSYTFLDGNNNIDTLPAIMVYGSDISSGITYPWAKRLKTISFKYKYLPNGIDTGVMYLTVGYRDRKTNKYINQGGAYYIFSKKETTYTKINLPLYYSSNHRCDTFVFAFINSFEKVNGNRVKPGTILLIDDIDTEWEDFPAVINIEEPELEVGIYPNPAIDRIHFKGIDGNNLKAKVTDLLGRQVIDAPLENASLDISGLNPGIFHVNVYDSQGVIIGSSYFHKK